MHVFSVFSLPCVNTKIHYQQVCELLTNYLVKPIELSTILGLCLGLELSFGLRLGLQFDLIKSFT